MGRARGHHVAPGTADRCLVLTTHSPSVAAQSNHLLIESPEVLDLDRFLRTIHDTSDFNVLALMLS